eukprot:GFYU01045385.1.p1 GENE.GFYU01045385.1~~GFYU01045385.1.p1  ORF type:complete len:101 (-),score=2.27 GFYU01045385.1:449-751(-)
MKTLLEQNKSDYVVPRKELRTKLRALSEKRVYFHMQQTIKKSKGSGDNKRSVHVNFTFEHGIFRVRPTIVSVFTRDDVVMSAMRHSLTSKMCCVLQSTHL